MKHLLVTATAALSLIGSACANPKPVTPSPTESAEPSDSREAKDAPSECVQTCTDARRTEAMDWSIIVSECEASCSEP
jgi:hypothetical protein